MSVSPITVGLVGVFGLLAIGMYGLLISRNLIKLVVAMQLLVKAAVLGLVVAGEVNGQMNISQSMAITVIVADTVVAVVALALAVQVRRRLGTLDTAALARLRG